MSRPNVFLIGAPKCGTTAWADYLSDHKEICFSAEKEPNYFCKDFKKYSWDVREDIYLDLFSHYNGEKYTTEASVQYIYSLDAPKNIYDFCPEAKIIIFVRNPLGFLRSYHNQLIQNLDENIVDFSAAWSASRQGYRASPPPTCREPHFLDYRSAASFAQHISRWLDCFPLEQVMIVQYEDWLGDSRAVWLKVMAFLGLEDDGRTEFPVVNPARFYRFKALARLTQRPPRFILRWTGWLARLLKRDRLGLAEIVRKWNLTEGYARPSRLEEMAEIDKEILADLHEDQIALARICADMAAIR